jgi:hypothetical protein
MAKPDGMVHSRGHVGGGNRADRDLGAMIRLQTTEYFRLSDCFQALVPSSVHACNHH